VKVAAYATLAGERSVQESVVDAVVEALHGKRWTVAP